MNEKNTLIKKIVPEISPELQDSYMAMLRNDSAKFANAIGNMIVKTARYTLHNPIEVEYLLRKHDEDSIRLKNSKGA